MADEIPDQEPEPETEFIPLQEIKDASVPISPREIDFLLNEIYDVISLYLLVSGKDVMGITTNPT